MDKIPELQLQKIYLQDFWSNHNGESGRRGVSRRSKKQTISALVDLSELHFTYKSTHTRAKFNKLKNSRKRFTGYKYCYACHSPAQCRHHIILLKNGGRNTKRNIVALCNDCHSLIHPWLK